jgi:hypothetical protein
MCELNNLVKKFVIAIVICLSLQFTHHPIRHQGKFLLEKPKCRFSERDSHRYPCEVYFLGQSRRQCVHKKPLFRLRRNRLLSTTKRRPHYLLLHVLGQCYSVHRILRFNITWYIREFIATICFVDDIHGHKRNNDHARYQ